MRNREKSLWAGAAFVAAFVVWTALVRTVDVRPVGPMGTEVGFAACNSAFHRLTGVHMQLYTVTDWLGLVPLLVCLLFAWMGLAQAVKRKSLWKVDRDVILLGIYYMLVILGYLLFEMFPINYRPILIEGRLEASYPSSTTLLVLSVMPTLVFQVNRRMLCGKVKKLIFVLTVLFSVLMVGGRLVSGVHWLSDIVGAVLLSAGLFDLYRTIVIRYDRRETR